MNKVSFSVSHEYSCDVLVAGGGVGGLAGKARSEVGEAAGVCASLAAQSNVSHFEVPVKRVQEIIIKNGGFIG